MGERMKVLGSPISLTEAQILLEGGIDIIDVKNVKEGSLGASFPWIIQEVVQAFPRKPGLLFSATLGDLPYKPGTAALAALGAAVSGVDYVKAGLYGVQSYSEALAMMQAVVRACKDYRATIQVVAAGYADYRRFGGLGLAELVAAAREAGADLVMVDTAIKDGSTLFEALSYAEIEAFVQAAQGAGLRVALAGSLQQAHLPLLMRLQPDVIGVRGALCQQGDRTTGITLERVRAFMQAATTAAPAVSVMGLGDE
jgi:(5-formylfuran-3-yl)methyl phosphate synthase